MYLGGAARAQAGSLRIEIPPEVRAEGGKIRVTNRLTGRSKTLEVSHRRTLTEDDVGDLVDPDGGFEPEFSLLTSDGKYRPLRSLSPASTKLAQSLIFDRPLWRGVGYDARDTEAARIFRLRKQMGPLQPWRPDPPFATPSPSPAVEAAKRSKLETAEIRRLFDEGWAALHSKQNDVAFTDFSALVAGEGSLSAEQRTQAHLGRGMARFHQEGCAKVEEDFVIAEKDPKHYDDVTYFRGLCLVEGKKFAEAEPLFRSLVNKTGSTYGESARFLFATTCENQEKYDDAESAYLDLIEFGEDANLVKISKERLEAVRALRAAKEYERKWYVAAATLALGYDTNVVSLPQSLAPSAYNITRPSSPSAMGLVFAELKIPYVKIFDPRVRYSFLTLSYLRSELKTNDIQSHDAGGSLSYTLNDQHRFSAGLGYNSVFLGPMGLSGEYIATPSLDASWQRTRGTAEAPLGDDTVSAKLSFARPRKHVELEVFDATSNSYLVGYRRTTRTESGNVFGPGADLEYKPAKGKENSIVALSALGRWDLPVGPQILEIYASQEVALIYTRYYESSGKRKDTLARYTGSIAKLWKPWLETRFQVIGTLNFSSLKANYQYRKGQVNLLVSAFF
jgi:hypothetical protein